MIFVKPGDSKIYFQYKGKTTCLNVADIKEWCYKHYPDEGIGECSDVELIGLIQKYQGKIYWFVSHLPSNNTLSVC